MLSPWCVEMELQLTRPTRNKYLVATTILTVMLENMTEYSQIPEMFTTQFITIMLNTFRNTRAKDKDDDFLKIVYHFFEVLENTLKKEEVTTKTKIAILKKLLISPGTLIFEKITRSKLIQHITMSLNEEGIKKLSKIYKEIVIANKPRDINDENEHWINLDRTYAAQMLVKLIGNPVVQKESEWRLEQAKFLLNLGFFKTDADSNVGIELAGMCSFIFFSSIKKKKNINFKLLI